MPRLRPTVTELVYMGFHLQLVRKWSLVRCYPSPLPLFYTENDPFLLLSQLFHLHVEAGTFTHALRKPATHSSGCSVGMVVLCEAHSGSEPSRQQVRQREQRWCSSGETVFNISVTLQNRPIWWKTRSWHWCVKLEHPFCICGMVRNGQNSSEVGRQNSFQLWEPQAGRCLFKRF